jgi:hypothetical protein
LSDKKEKIYVWNPKKKITFAAESLFDNIAPQSAEIRAVPKSLPLILKNSAKRLSIKQLIQTG